MALLDSHTALYVLMKDGLLKGLSGSYVDDLLRAGTPGCQNCLKTHSKFEMSNDEPLPLTFPGLQLSDNKFSGYELDQNHYLRTLEELSSSASFSEFRSMRMKLAWMSESRRTASSRSPNWPKLPRPSSLSTSRSATGLLTALSVTMC